MLRARDEPKVVSERFEPNNHERRHKNYVDFELLRNDKAVKSESIN